MGSDINREHRKWRPSLLIVNYICLLSGKTNPEMPHFLLRASFWKLPPPSIMVKKSLHLHLHVRHRDREGFIQWKGKESQKEKRQQHMKQTSTGQFLPTAIEL